MYEVGYGTVTSLHLFPEPFMQIQQINEKKKKNDSMVGIKQGELSTDCLLDY
jgi:hypothetical protein